MPRSPWKFPAYAGLAIVWSAVAWCSPTAAESLDGPAIARVIQQMDAQDYAVRQRALDKLSALAAAAESRGQLAAEVDRALAGKLSFEVRRQLITLRRDLPVATPAPVERQEILAWLDELDGDSFAARSTALQRLTAAIEKTETAAILLGELQQRLSEAAPATDARRVQLALYRELRGRWLTSTVAWPLPPIERSQWMGWIDKFCEPAKMDSAAEQRGEAPLSYDGEDPYEALAANSADGQPLGATWRTLTDLISRPDYTDEVRKELQARLEQSTDTAVSERLEQLLAWYDPAMVAEIWNHQQVYGIQHMLVDVPQMSIGQKGPTHFDRIDDRTAHCVRGNALDPGDYPVGVAIPHPKVEESYLYHLINLPTPRRRLAFDYYSRRPAADRLRELSERTLDRLVAQRRRLTEHEWNYFRQLDAGALSVFAGRYLAAVPDAARYEFNGSPTDHALICELLIKLGTREALPGLTVEGTSGALSKLSDTLPVNFAYVAALSIAARDLDPAVDTWLAAQISQAAPLSLTADAPDFGATCAALLLARHDQSARAFGLTTAPDEQIDANFFAGFRFSHPDDRAAVIEWWGKEVARDKDRRVQP